MSRMLEGATCVVTGAGRGIGRFIAETFAREGARLALCARSEAQLQDARRSIEEAFGAEVLVRSVDVARGDAVRAFADEVLERFARVDVLVNNAGTYGPVGPLVEVDPRAWVGAVAVNLFGTMHVLRAFAPAMVAAGAGRIVNLAGGGVGGPNPPTNVSAYTASKSAIVSLTETLALELAPHGVTVNAVAPGAISTALIDAVIEAGPEAAGAGFHERSLRQRERGDPIEPVGELMLLLASGRTGPLTGKLLSAKWDPKERLGEDAERLNASSMYTLRRIDEVLFCEGKGA